MKFGIDFGTSYSVACVVDPITGVIDRLMPEYEYGIPSLFYYQPGLGPSTGKQAEEDAGTDTQLVREIKMDLMSSRTFEHSEHRQTFTARQIVGYILAEVMQTALNRADYLLLDEPLEGVVISVPAKFNHNEREAILEAARISKEIILKDPNIPGKAKKDIEPCTVLGLIKEPVAAALYYFEKKAPANQTRILVYDLGGGTCDVALVEADSSQREHYRVIDADMLRIGGKDWDSRLEEYVKKELRKRNRNVSSLSLKNDVILAKESFSDLRRDKARVTVPNDKGGNDEIYISRREFYALTDDLLEKTIRMTKGLLEKNSNYPVKKLILVGGSCKMPQVPEALQRAFPGMDVRVMEPEYAVARGAAIYATEKNALTDIAPYSYGIRAIKDHKRSLRDEEVRNLIKRKEPLPKISKYSFLKPTDGPKVSIQVYESDSTVDTYDYVPDKLDPIMEVTFPFPPGTPVGTPFRVTMQLTRDGILEIVADDCMGHVMRGEKQLLL